jgi:hypothetical protein
MEGVNITVYLPPLINISALLEILALLLKIHLIVNFGGESVSSVPLL